MINASVNGRGIHTPSSRIPIRSIPNFPVARSTISWTDHFRTNSSVRPSGFYELNIKKKKKKKEEKRREERRREEKKTMVFRSRRAERSSSFSLSIFVTEILEAATLMATFDSTRSSKSGASCISNGVIEYLPTSFSSESLRTEDRSLYIYWGE